MIGCLVSAAAIADEGAHWEDLGSCREWPEQARSSLLLGASTPPVTSHLLLPTIKLYN